MLEGMLGAALLIIAFSVGYVVGGRKTPPKPEIALKETAEEINRKKNFKRFMNYDDGGNAD